MSGTKEKELFYRMLSDSRDDERQKAFAELMGSSDERMRDIARIGRLVSEVLARKSEPARLKEAFEIAEELVQTSYYNGFFETCGQVLMEEGLSMEKGDERREFLGWGLSMMERAMGAFMPLSDGSMRMIREAKTTESALSKRVDDLVLSNESLAPRFGAAETGPEKPSERRGKRRGRV